MAPIPKPKDKPKLRKERDKKKYLYKESYENGIPCIDEDCESTTRRKPCPHCGRTKMRGRVEIATRTGFVEMERCWNVEINLFNQKSEEDQENGLLKLFRPPRYIEELKD